MKLTVSSWRMPDGLQLEWSDDAEGKLERKASEIVVTLLVAGEMQYRLSEAHFRDRLIQMKHQLIQGQLQAAEERRLQEVAEKRSGNKHILMVYWRMPEILNEPNNPRLRSRGSGNQRNSEQPY